MVLIEAGRGIDWKKKLGKEYKEFLPKFVRWRSYSNTDPTAWVNMTDTFNDSLLAALFEHDGTIRDASEVLKICGQTGFRFYEPGAEMVLAGAYMELKDFEQAESNANSAYEKAVGMKYRWAEIKAGSLPNACRDSGKGKKGKYIGRNAQKSAL